MRKVQSGSFSLPLLQILLQLRDERLGIWKRKGGLHNSLHVHMTHQSISTSARFDRSQRDAYHTSIVTAPPTLLPNEVHTRFLFPFRFDSRLVSKIHEALGTQPYWNAREPNSNFRGEYLPDFLAVYFGSAARWNYFQIDPDQSKRWLGMGLDLWQERLRQDEYAVKDGFIRTAVLSHTDGRGIELFLVDEGAGVLSVTLTARTSEGRAFTMDQVKSFCYSLCQSEPRKCTLLRAKGNAAAPPGEPSEEEQRSVTRGASTDFAPGGWFTLISFFRFLLRPLEESAADCHSLHDSAMLIPFTVLRFPIAESGPVERTDEVVLHASLLAQVDEAAHPLPGSDDPGVLVQMFHTDEIAAVSCMGAAFLLWDIGVQYDSAKIASRRDRYFVGFLAALLQRLVLMRLSMDAARLIRQEDLESSSLSLQNLRRATLQYVAGGHFIEVSSREVLNRYFTMCQRAHRVPRYLALVQQTITDMDAALQSARQHASLEKLNELGGKQQKSLHVMESTQSKVEWIEVFVITFYTAELCYVMAETWRLRAEVVQVAILVFLLAGFGAAVFLVRPWETDQQPTRDGLLRKPQRPPARLFIVGLIACVMLAAFLFVGVMLRDPSAEAGSNAATDRELEDVRSELRTMRNQQTQMLSALAARDAFDKACPAACLKRFPEAAALAKEADSRLRSGDMVEALKLWNSARGAAVRR